MSDSLYDGRRFRVVTFVDTMTRESPAIEVARSFSGQLVAEMLDRLAQLLGLPKAIQVDNGPEFTSKALDEWAARNKVKLVFSRPGMPTDNPFIEAFNGRVRAVCRDQHWFTSIEDAQATIEAWQREYNTERPHTALDNLTRAAYRAKWEQKQVLSEIR
jgi:putative transposase